MEKNRLDYIDSLRAAAAIGIVIFHLRVIAHGAPLPAPDWSQGFIYWVLGSGVQLFFVISAFLLSMLASSYDKKSRPVLSFYIKRFFRIAPLFYFAIIVWSFEVRIPLTTQLALNVTFLLNLFSSSQQSVIFAGWTIGVEMMFYLIFPYLHRMIPSLPAKLLALMAALLASIVMPVAIEWAGIVAEDGRSEYHMLSIVRHLPTFIMGMIAFDAVIMLRGSKHARLVSTSLVGTAAIIFSLLIQGWTALLEPLYYQSLACAFLLVAVASTSFPGVNAVTAFLGRISYSIYLFHGLIIIKMGTLFSLIYETGYPAAVCFGLAILFALSAIIPVSAATYYLVEQPGNRLGRKLLARLDRRHPTLNIPASTTPAPY
jgi:peptidoglycan/LPS O-acetylase OafA/YrhL